jgi:holliday junction DNA helicase RuvA
MISYLEGTALFPTATTITALVNGVGYLVHCSSRTLSTVQANDKIQLHVELQVREDAFTLYGFRELEEKHWFHKLCQVQGVGGRVALAILSAFSPATLHLAIQTQDANLLRKADGVGAKLAQRLVLELKDKTSPMPMTADAPMAADDALLGLLALGYTQADAVTALAKVPAGDTPTRLKAALKIMGR